MLIAIMKAIYRFLVWQFDALYYYFDPIDHQGSTTTSKRQEKEATRERLSCWNGKFIFPVILLCLISVYGNLAVPHWGYGVPLTREALKATPALLYRQIYPQAMWPQTDVAAWIAVFGSASIYASFWHNLWTIPRYVRFQLMKGNVIRKTVLIIGQTTLPFAESAKILSIHGRFKVLSFYLLAGITIVTILFIEVNVYLNAFYSLSGNLIFICLLLLPTLMLYSLYALFGMTVFIILAIVFLQIRQRSVLSQFTALNKEMEQLKADKPRGARRQLQQQQVLSLIQRNAALNAVALSVCGDIESYATFWRGPLTCFFVTYITLQSYLAYTVFFIGGIPFLLKGAFLYMVLFISLALFLLISSCAKLVKGNRAIELANRSFTLSLLKARGALSQLPLRQKLKLEALSLNGRLRSYAFCLFDNYRITSKTFYMVFSNTSLFFMLVFKTAS